MNAALWVCNESILNMGFKLPRSGGALPHDCCPAIRDAFNRGHKVQSPGSEQTWSIFSWYQATQFIHILPLHPSFPSLLIESRTLAHSIQSVEL